MALGKKRIVAQKSNSKHPRHVDNDGDGLGLGLELVQYKRGFGRKRILISSGDSIIASPVGENPSKKLCDTRTQEIQLEDLPQDILTLIAKHSHFAYNTPRKTSVFRHSRFNLNQPFGFEDEIDREMDAPGAPLQKRYHSSRINRDDDDSGVSVALFR